MIQEKVQAMIAHLKASLWFVPSLMTAVAIVLAVVTVRVDQSLSTEMSPEVWFLFSATADGAREVLSTIAGSIITVTGVVFSITIVALQLASTEYTPRVLRTFTENRPTQVVLGVFIATFTYSLLVLRLLRSEADDIDRFVPGISVTLAVLLALASIAALIFFVNHIAHAIRVETVLDQITSEVLDRIDILFPVELGEPADADVWPDAPTPDGKTSTTVSADTSGYLQQVDENALLQLTDEHDLLVKMVSPVGTFVIKGDPLLTVARGRIDEDVEEDLRHAFHIGSERTLYQDVTRGTIELTDIALRALSPSLNDPTTAIACIDRLTQIMVTLSLRRFPTPFRKGEDGKIRVIAARPTFEEMIRLPYGQLREASASQPAVAERLLGSLARVAKEAPPDRIPPLQEQLRELREAIRRSVKGAGDQERLERVADRVLAELQDGFVRNGEIGGTRERSTPSAEVYEP